MSYQAYLDAIEAKTGHTPAALVTRAHERGFGPATKAGEIVAWLAADFGLDRFTSGRLVDEHGAAAVAH